MQDKILVVDDEHEIADLIALYLQNENFEVFKFYTAAEALECIQAEKLDLAILDVMLPDMSGFQLCQKIREKYQYPVIMLTAKGEEIDKITGLTPVSYTHLQRTRSAQTALKTCFQPVPAGTTARTGKTPSRPRSRTTGIPTSRSRKR